VISIFETSILAIKNPLQDGIKEGGGELGFESREDSLARRVVFGDVADVGGEIAKMRDALAHRHQGGTHD